LNANSPLILPETKVDAAGALLAQAFHHDSLFTYALPDEHERANRTPGFFAPVARFGHLYGVVHTTTDLSAVAVWFRPGDTEMDEARLQASGMSHTAQAIGEAPFARIMNVIAPLDALRRADAPEPHWYLALLGVNPDLQRRGLGSAVVQPILEQADAHDTPCYLETQEERNIAFYERLGFRVLREIDHRESGVRNWTFRRDARANP
jgi:ribosomal protein S18 acetylase RimI-like enzyme